MFNLFSMSLCSDGGIKWLLGQDNWQLWSLVAVFLALLLVGVILAFTKKEVLSTYVKWSLVGFAVFTVICLIVNLSLQMSEDAEKYGILDYQKYFIICGILLILSALVVSVTNMLLKENVLCKKIAKIIGLLLLLSSVGLFIAGMVSVEDLGYIEDGEVFITMEKGGQIAITAVTILVFIGMCIFTMIPNKNKTKTNNTLALVYGGVSIAMSFALSYARVFKLPAGGSITIASLLPLALYSYMFGAKKGVMAGMIYGVLQIMQDPWIVHPTQVLLDYVLAFGMIGFTGLFRFIKNKPVGLGVGTFFASLLRYVCHVVSGGLFFFAYMPSEFVDSGFTAFGWSAFYNCFVFADIAIVVVAGVLLMMSKQVRSLTADVSNRYLTVISPRKVTSTESKAEVNVLNNAETEQTAESVAEDK